MKTKKKKNQIKITPLRCFGVAIHRARIDYKYLLDGSIWHGINNIGIHTAGKLNSRCFVVVTWCVCVLVTWCTYFVAIDCIECIPYEVNVI